MSKEIEERKTAYSEFMNQKNRTEREIEKLEQIPEVQQYIQYRKLYDSILSMEQEMKIREMRDCQHAFVKTEVVSDRDYDRVEKVPVYHCVRCGLTNEYDVKGISDLKGYIGLKMPEIFASTVQNGILLSQEKCSLDMGRELYFRIITENPDISFQDLKSKFESQLSINAQNDCNAKKHR